MIGGKIQKRSPTILVERRPGTPTSRTEKSRAKAESYTSNTTPTAAGPAEETRRQKKPGRSARTTPRSTSQPAVDHLAPSATTRDRNVRLPSGLVTPWDVTSEQLVKELEAYTLEEIGRNMAEADAMAPKPPPAPQPLSQSNTVVSLRIKKGASSKFKPKVPAQRYHERHPEVMAPPTVDEPEQDQTDDDGDFVIDTYVRMPAEEVDVNDKNHIGYIVLEDQPDIDEFYEEDEQQNEDEEEYDEDDENGPFYIILLLTRCLFTDSLKLRIITRQTTQTRKSTLMMSTIVMHTGTAPATPPTRRNLTRMITTRWMKTETILQDTPGSSRASRPG